MRGASTIEMQFVRTVSSKYDKTVSRKVRECLLAVIIQFRYSKSQILRAYLGVAYFGTLLTGAEDASRKIFGVSTDSLDLHQSAKLAATLIYPRPFEPNEKWSKKALQRASYIETPYVRNEQKLNQLPN